MATEKTIVFTLAQLREQAKHLSVPRSQRAGGGYGLTRAQVEKGIKALSSGRTERPVTLGRTGARDQVRLVAVRTERDRKAYIG